MIEAILIVFFAGMMLLYSSWIVFILIPVKEDKDSGFELDLTIIIPARNEGESIEGTLKAALDAEYSGEKEIIVIDDGSTDNTRDISRENGAKVYTIEHGGKANAINYGLQKANGEIVLVLDADSMLDKKALKKITLPFVKEEMGAVSGVIRADMNKNPLVWFQDLEYILSSAWRRICENTRGTYLLPGFAAFRKEALEKIGGFERDTLSEDFDIGVRLKKAGYEMTMANALIYTRVPQDLKSLARQRMRWGKGTLQVIKKHKDILFNRSYGTASFYGIPTQMYWFVYGIFCIPLTLHQMLGGYLEYFIAYGNYLSLDVLRYFFGWATMYGMVEYMYRTFMGDYATTTFFFFAAGVFALNLFYLVIAIKKIGKADIRHLASIFFFFPYSVFTLSAYVYPALGEVVRWRGGKVNIWEKGG